MKPRMLMCVGLALAGLWIVAGCGRQKQEAPPASPGASDAPSTAPAKPRPPEVKYRPMSDRAQEAALKVIGPSVPRENRIAIPDLRATAKVGDRVVVEAKIMGRLAPFDPKLAEVLVGDENTVASCDLLGIDERCPTPWDVHLEDPGYVRDGTALIRLVDAEGEVLKGSLRGVGGLTELSRVRVAGEVVDVPAEGPLVIKAEALELLSR